MATKNQILSNTLFQIVGKIVSIVASLVVVKIITGLGKETYDAYLTSYEFLAFFGIMADMGLYSMAVHTMSREKARIPYFLGNILSLRLVFIVFVTILAGVVAQFIPSYPDIVKIGVWITGLSMALTIVAGTLSSVLQSTMKIQYFSGFMALGKLFLAIAIYLFTTHGSFTGNDLFFALLWIGVASNIIFLTGVYFSVKKIVKIKLLWDFSFIKQFLKESLPLGASLILETLYLRLDTVLISIILGISSAGTYGIATRVLESLRILCVYFGQASLPRFSVENKAESAKTLAWGVQKILVYGLPVILGGIFFAEDIILLISSADFLSSTLNSPGAERMVQFLLPAVAILGVNQLMIQKLISEKAQKYLLRINLLALAFNAGINLLFLREYGIAVAAIGTVLSELTVLGLILKKVGLDWVRFLDFKVILAVMLGLLGMISMIYLTHEDFLFIISGLFGVIAYIVVGIGICGWKLFLKGEK